MINMYRTLLIILGVLTVFSLGDEFEHADHMTIKISDVRAGKDRDNFEKYLYQGYWKNKYVWTPKWVKSLQKNTIYSPTWKRVWYQTKVKEWVSVHVPPPAWVATVPGKLTVKLPQ